MSFEEKYLKYKEKYLSLKNMTGGAIGPVIPLPDNSYKPVATGSIDILVQKIGQQENMTSPNFQDSWIWNPPRLNEGIDFHIVGEWWHNDNISMHGASAMLNRDINLTIANKRFVIKTGTACSLFVHNVMNVDVKKITIRLDNMELVPESGCVLQ